MKKAAVEVVVEKKGIAVFVVGNSRWWEEESVSGLIGRVEGFEMQ